MTELELLKRRVDALEDTVIWLRGRLASLLPERHYCPHCKATVHKDAKACGACGRSWGKPKDPNDGLPV